MHGVSGTAVSAAISSAGQSASEKSSTVQTESDENAWFSLPARGLLGTDPGLALHIITNKTISESSGYRYASGERSMPLNVFRGMLHDPQGATWLAVLMDGCTAPWWLDYERHRRMGEAADKAR